MTTLNEEITFLSNQVSDKLSGPITFEKLQIRIQCVNMLMLKRIMENTNTGASTDWVLR